MRFRKNLSAVVEIGNVLDLAPQLRVNGKVTKDSFVDMLLFRKMTTEEKAKYLLIGLLHRGEDNIISELDYTGYERIAIERTSQNFQLSKVNLLTNHNLRDILKREKIVNAMVLKKRIEFAKPDKMVTISHVGIADYTGNLFAVGELFKPVTIFESVSFEPNDLVIYENFFNSGIIT